MEIAASVVRSRRSSWPRAIGSPSPPRSGEGPEGTLTVRADVTDGEGARRKAAFAQVEDALGPVEVVVANAGITRDMLLMRG